MKLKDKFNDIPKHKLDHDNLTKTFEELDKKLSILDDETLNWIKEKIMWHTSEAFIRGYDSTKFTQITGIGLDKIDKDIDEVLEKETPESLTTWLENKRKKE